MGVTRLFQISHLIKNLFNILILSLIFFSCSLQIQDGPFIVYYQNGSIKGEGIYKNGNLEGKYLSYYENGKVEKKIILEL